MAIDARAPKFDGGIVTRLDCLPFGIVVNKYSQRFYDEGEDFWPKRYAIWGRLVAQQPEQIAYSIIDSKSIDLFMPSVFPPIKADSIAGKSRASGGAAAVNTPGGKNQAGQAAPNAEQEFRENVGGVSEFETKLKELWNKRTQLMKTKKKKKKKKNRGGLKRSGTKAFDTGSGYDDDKTSFMTMTVVD